LLNGQSHAFRLDPALVPGVRTIGATFSITSVPEPGTLLPAAFALVFAWIWGLRSRLAAPGRSRY
jgi:hypothetical protein